MVFLPKQSANICIKRAENFLELANGPLPIGGVKGDLRRMGLVMAVAALDSYMHAMVLRRVADVRKRAQLPKSLRKLDIPFSDIADLADAAISAQQKNTRARPWVRVKDCLRARILKSTFQSYDQVATAFALAGIKDAWEEVGKDLDEKPGEIKGWLDAVVHRRNQIVHEGDLERASRPRELKYNNVEQAEVAYHVSEMKSLIRAINRVVDKQSSL